MHILTKGAAYPSDAVGFCLDLQNTTQKTKDRGPRTPLKSGGALLVTLVVLL
jgi:hypothetical protein